PITIDPVTGQGTANIDGGTPGNFITWGDPPSQLTRISPYIDPNSSGSAVFTSTQTFGTYGSNFANSLCGTNSASYINVGMYNQACGSTTKQLIINPTIHKAVISPTFTTACIGTSVTLTATRSGGSTPYGNGTWTAYNNPSWIVSQNSNSCTISAPAFSGGGSITVYYTSVDSKGCYNDGWAGATINFTNTAATGNTGGWGSGQLVNTACANNDILKSSDFVSQYLGTNVIHYINNDNQLGYYYYDRTSAYCPGSTSWIQNQGLEANLPSSPISLSNNLPASGTPLAGGVSYNNNLGGYYYQLFYIGSNNRLNRANGDGSINTFTNFIYSTLPGNLIFDGTFIYYAESLFIRKTDGDVTNVPLSNFINVSPLANNVSGKYIALLGNVIYYSGTNGNLWGVNTTGIPVSFNTNKTILSTSDIKDVDGNLVYLKDPTTLVYYVPSGNTGTTTEIPLGTVFPSGVTATGRLAPVPNVSGKSIFVTASDGNLYQVIFGSGAWKVVKATSASVADNSKNTISGGYAVYNGSNILYTNTVGNIWNLFGTGCGNTLRLEAPEDTTKSY
ncbi:MAG: hypothetical protein K2Q22_04960, partial [Cytophagales bacterium]|nr:hypothetical protein [Cytophagales bacterium]